MLLVSQFLGLQNSHLKLLLAINGVVKVLGILFSLPEFLPFHCRQFMLPFSVLDPFVMFTLGGGDNLERSLDRLIKSHLKISDLRWTSEQNREESRGFRNTTQLRLKLRLIFISSIVFRRMAVRTAPHWQEAVRCVFLAEVREVQHTMGLGGHQHKVLRELSCLILPTRCSAKLLLTEELFLEFST